jgi:hypothetical protein
MGGDPLPRTLPMAWPTNGHGTPKGVQKSGGRERQHTGEENMVKEGRAAKRKNKSERRNNKKQTNERVKLVWDGRLTKLRGSAGNVGDSSPRPGQYQLRTTRTSPACA